MDAKVPGEIQPPRPAGGSRRNGAGHRARGRNAAATRAVSPGSTIPTRIAASAKQGFPLAQSRMAALYYQGDGVAQDKVTAYAWALLAADAGDGDAQALLAAMDSGHELSDDQLARAARTADQLAQSLTGGA